MSWSPAWIIYSKGPDWKTMPGVVVTPIWRLRQENGSHWAQSQSGLHYMVRCASKQKAQHQNTPK